MAIKKGDFVEVEYTGTLADEQLIFDTTDEKLAKEHEIWDKQTVYGPITVCIGEGQLLKGLDQEMEGKDLEKEYTVKLSAENGFGKKDAKLIRMIPFGVFKKQQIMPQPGMQVNVDGMVGVIKTAAGGRCLVDFNHPLSGKELVYTIKANKIITDDTAKIRSIMHLNFNMKSDREFKECTAKITTPVEIPEPIQKMIEEQLKEKISSVKKTEFSVKKPTPTK